jgi:hypothetical protein
MATLQNTQPGNMNPLSASGFLFSIQKLPHVNYFLTGISLPEISLDQPQRATPFGDQPLAGSKLTFGQLNIRFRIDENMQNYREIFRWMTALGFPGGFEQTRSLARTSANPAGLTYSDATLIMTSSANNPNVKANFIDLYPISLTTGEFSVDKTDVEPMEGTASFAYRSYDLLDVV